MESENQKFDVADIVFAIQDADESVKSPLLRLLDLGPVERNDALKRLALSLKNQEAPQSLIDALLYLQRSEVAAQVAIELRGKGSGGHPSFFQKFLGFLRP